MPGDFVRLFIGLRATVSLLILVAFLSGCSAAAPELSLHEARALEGSNAVAAPVVAGWQPNNLGSRYCDPSAEPFWSWNDPALFQCAAAGPSSEPSTSPARQDENLFSIDYVKRVGRDIKHTFTAPAYWDTGDWILAGGVVAGVGTAFAFDNQIQRAAQRNRNSTTDHVFNAIQPLGAEYSAGVLAAFYLGGELFKDANAKAVALDGISASIIASGLIVQPVKFIVGRNRPSVRHGDSRFVPFGGSYSFPSGHTTQAFAVATVIAEHYDSPWIKIASYGLASAVGFARVNNNNHWTSDVLAGAAIGFFVGETVVHFNHQVSVMPMVGPDVKGLEVSWSF